MNYISDEDLARALRESRGLSPESDETRSIQAKREDDEQLREELESLSANPLSKFGKSLYRLMVKKWPKAEDNYDWVYAPGELELIPMHESSDFASSRVKLAHGGLTAVAPVVGVSEPQAAIPQAANSNVELGFVKKEQAGVQYAIHSRADVELREVFRQMCLATVRLNGLKVSRSQKVASGSDVLGSSEMDVKLSSSTQLVLRDLQVLASDKLNETSYAVGLYGQFIPLRKISSPNNALPFVVNGKPVTSPARPSMRAGTPQFDKIVGDTHNRRLSIDEAHRALEVAADIKSVLQSIEHALTKYQSKTFMSYTASPRRAWVTAVEYIVNIFKSKSEREFPCTHRLHKGCVERVEWKLDRNSSSELALRGTAGHMRDYWFQLHNHQLSLRWHNKAEQTQPQTIFQVGSSEPVAAGEGMVAGLENAHVDYDRAVEIMGSLKEFVERQTQVHS